MSFDLKTFSTSTVSELQFLVWNEPFVEGYNRIYFSERTRVQLRLRKHKKMRMASAYTEGINIQLSVNLSFFFLTFYFEMNIDGQKVAKLTQKLQW